MTNIQWLCAVITCSMILFPSRINTVLGIWFETVKTVVLRKPERKLDPVEVEFDSRGPPSRPAITPIEYLTSTV